MNKELKQSFNRLISRKFIIVVGMLISAHWLMNYGHISDQVYMYVILGTVAVYITGNVTQNIKLSTKSESGVTITNDTKAADVTIPWGPAVESIVNQIKATVNNCKAP